MEVIIAHFECSLSPPDDLLLAVVVSSFDGLGHVSESRETWLSGQSVGGQSLQTPASGLSLLQRGQTSDVLPPEQTQRVLQISFPQGGLGNATQSWLNSGCRKADLRLCFWCVLRSYLSPKLLGELLQVLQAKQRLLQSSFSLVFSSLQQNPTLLYIAESFTFTETHKTPCWNM